MAKRAVGRRLKNLSWGSVLRSEVRASWGEYAPQNAAGRLSGQKMNVETLWTQFFSDPSQWLDHRLEKENARYPDFKHKKTRNSLWQNGELNPPWVEAQLEAMAPGTVQVSLHTWNTRIARYVKDGQFVKAINLFQQLEEEGINPNSYSFVPVLNACSNLRDLGEGKRIHSLIVRSSCKSDVYVGNCLVDMYTKCGSIEDAWRVFKKMHKRDVIAWNTMILGYVKCGKAQRAVELSWQMKWEGVEPSPATFVAVLNACASVGVLEQGRRVHEQIIQKGCESDVFVSNGLIDMYTKCGSIDDAQRVHNMMPRRDVVSWSTMIRGYVKCGQGQKALQLFQQMQEEGVEPNPVTFVAVLSACSNILALAEGRYMHEEIIRRGYESDIYIGNSLVDMYAKCGIIEDAQNVFDNMPIHDVVSWSAMILAYVKCGEGQKALELSQQMRKEGVNADRVTFLGLLNACSSVMALEEGRRVHAQIIQTGCDSDLSVASCLVDMYAKCGSIEDAERVFNKMPTRNVVSWTAMLGGYSMHGHVKEALIHFQWMCREQVEINGVTFISLLSACSHGGLVDEGLHYFESMGARISPTVAHCACMVDLLGRAGRLHEAEYLIQAMSCGPNSTVWKCLLGACRLHGNPEIGERVAERVLELDPDNAAAYILLSSIYAAAGKWDSSANVRRERLGRKVERWSCRSLIEVDNVVHSFTGKDDKHPQIMEIHTEASRLCKSMEEAGYVPDARAMFHDGEEKGICLCLYSEKLAIACGLISTPPGTPLRILRHLPLCVNCHTATKFIAKIVGRTIIVRDTNRFHHFEDGLCSCSDYW